MASQEMLTFLPAGSLVGGASGEGGGATASTARRARGEKMCRLWGSLFHHLPSSIQPIVHNDVGFASL